jgi:hypothetical protein
MWIALNILVYLYLDQMLQPPPIPLYLSNEQKGSYAKLISYSELFY